MESPWDGGTEVCSNGPGCMTKMAASPYMVNTLKKSSPKSKGRWPWHLVCSIGCSSTTKFIKMMTWVDRDLFYGKVKFGPTLLYGKNGKQWIFQKLLSCTIWNWQQMTEKTRSFCWHQNCVSWGLYAHCPGAIYMYKIIKSDLKDISLKLETNGQSDKVFLLTSKFCPMGAVCPCPGTIYMY